MHVLCDDARMLGDDVIRVSPAVICGYCRFMHREVMRLGVQS